MYKYTGFRSTFTSGMNDNVQKVDFLKMFIHFYYYLSYKYKAIITSYYIIDLSDLVFGVNL